MKLRYSSAELHWVRQARRHVDKVAEEEVSIDACVSEFAPSNGPRRECRDQFVDFGDRVKFTLRHRGTRFCSALSSFVRNTM